jgi:hypothetical protein
MNRQKEIRKIIPFIIASKISRNKFSKGAGTKTEMKTQTQTYAATIT